jgi:hypothetical protein
MTQRPQIIDPFLADFVDRYRQASELSDRGSVDYLDKLLRRYLDEMSETYPCPFCRVLLEAERLLDPKGAFTRVMDLEDLVFMLSGFIHRPWLRENPMMQRAQWRFVEALLIAIQAQPMLECEELNVRYVHLWQHINWALRRSKAGQRV